jgi:hypothetical protein
LDRDFAAQTLNDHFDSKCFFERMPDQNPDLNLKFKTEPNPDKKKISLCPQHCCRLQLTGCLRTATHCSGGKLDLKFSVAV